MKRRDDGHCIQYAFVGSQIVYDTDRLTDAQVQDIANSRLRVERYNRCPECESWTMDGPRMRNEINCPAITDRCQ